MKYCPDCGLKTFTGTGESDHEMGDYWACFSCGHRVSMHELDSTVYTAQIKQPTKKFEPLYSYAEMAISRFMVNAIMDSFVGPVLYFGEKLSTDAKKGNKVTFRRTDPFNAARWTA